MTILLFDMDGVLLKARAYHRALSETVALVGKALGYRNAGLTQEDIDLFESVGITSEWESSAICSALMLRDVWSIHPTTIIPKEPPLHELPQHHLKLPDFQSFLQSPEMSGSLSERGRIRAYKALIADINGYSEQQTECLHAILHEAHNIHGSLTHRIFQELVLGSQLFYECYGLDRNFNVDGYLQTEDIPSLNRDMHDQLLEWLNHPDHSAAVFTLRPSKPPEGIFDTPEAEMGLKVVDLEDFPLVGHGGLTWLAEQKGVIVEELIKPSPIHVLAAVRCSCGDLLEQALLTAHELAVDEKITDSWLELRGEEIIAFEDSVTGFQSAQNAQRVLEQANIKINLRLMGVSTSPLKQNALENGGAEKVYEDLNQALEAVLK